MDDDGDNGDFLKATFGEESLHRQPGKVTLKELEQRVIWMETRHRRIALFLERLSKLEAAFKALERRIEIQEIGHAGLSKAVSLNGRDIIALMEKFEKIKKVLE